MYQQKIRKYANSHIPYIPSKPNTSSYIWLTFSYCLAFFIYSFLATIFTFPNLIYPYRLNLTTTFLLKFLDLTTNISTL